MIPRLKRTQSHVCLCGSVAFPYKPQTCSNFPGLAYTEPFRLLSDEGTAVLRGIVDQHQVCTLHARGTRSGTDSSEQQRAPVSTSEDSEWQLEANENQ